MAEQIDRWLRDATVDRLIVTVLALLVLYLVSRFIRGSVSQHVSDPDARYRLRKLVTFITYAVALLVLIVSFSERLSGLSVAFGVAGAGIAFALQEVIASVAGWVAVSIGSFYAPGDRVQLGGIKGDVIDISVLRTTLMEIGEWVGADQYNGRIVRVANSFVFKEPVYNYSADFPFLWDEISLPIRYGSDWESARAMLERVAKEVCGGYAIESREAWRQAVRKYRLEEATVEPAVTLAANDNWIQFTARYVVDYRQRRTVRDRLYTRILEEVDRSAGRIRLASGTVEVVNLPRFDVKLTGTEGSIDPHYAP